MLFYRCQLKSNRHEQGNIDFPDTASRQPNPVKVKPLSIQNAGTPVLHLPPIMVDALRPAKRSYQIKILKIFFYHQKSIHILF